MIKVAIVLLNYNGKKYLEEFLPDVIKYSNHHEVIIVDNHSSDGSVTFLQKEYPNIRLVVLEENKGFSGGYNSALQQIEAEYYVLLNTDVKVTPNWIDPIITLMDRNDDIAACQPKILSYYEPEKFEYAGAAGGFIDYLGFPFCRGRIFATIEEDHHQYDDIADVFWASGACLFIRSSLFHFAGGFDDDFFAHMEEIDLCWRLKNAGFRICYNSGSVVYHIGGGTLPVTHPHKTYLNFRNNITMLYKNSTTFQFISKYPLRFGLDLLAAFKFLLSQSSANFIAVIKGHYHFWKRLKVNKRKKNATKSAVNEFNFKEVLSSSIVFEYYLKRNRTFNRLKF